MALAVQTVEGWLCRFRDLVSDFGSLTDIAGQCFRDDVGILRGVYIASYLMQNSRHLHILAFSEAEQCPWVFKKNFLKTDPDRPKSCTSGTLRNTPTFEKTSQCGEAHK
ncbi:hypothetical protein KL942_004717 [Ogataea angusta]|uniref:Uncharacterized protein n=1 Tax=Pichia angusta TaxID=870730 RepID=A0ABQ7RSD3_PICAN|nr:hypothetical protein KL909_004429 [Ogataea angusta]KAG7836799.1 hypothetical protein KL942_004717 [Ogataea angusta]KAG7846491.1 hypothetical protein KL940_004443 [Ogataea angusta]